MDVMSIYLCSYALLHLGDIQLDMRFELQVLFMCRMNFIFDGVFQIGHLRIVSISVRTR